ncbi:hypothetical protein, partial [Sicyoidochytrium minutum DNA virus]
VRYFDIALEKEPLCLFF